VIRTPAALALATLLVSSLVHAKPDRPAHVALVVDGTAKSSDIDLCAAAVELIQRMKSVDHLGLWKTDENAISVMPLSTLGSGNVFSRARKKAAKMCREQAPSSNLEATLSESVEKLSDYAKANVSGTRAVVLIYAGDDDGDASALNNLKRRLERWRISEDKPLEEKCPDPSQGNTCACNPKCDKHVAIHAISVGSSANSKLLRALAIASGGAFYEATDELHLRRAIQRTAANLIRARAMQQVVGTSLKLRRTPRKYDPNEDDEDDLAYKFPSEYYPSTDEDSILEKTGAWVWWLIGFALCLCIAGLMAPFMRRREKKSTPGVRESQMTAAPLATVDTRGYFSEQTGEIEAPQWERGSEQIARAQFQSQMPEHNSFTVSSDGPGITVGRHNSNTVVITNATCSGTHAEVRWKRGRLTVEDLHSSNGTYVNDQRIDASTLSSGDVVRFGSIAFEVTGDTEVSMDDSDQPLLYADTIESPAIDESGEPIPQSGPAQCDMHPHVAAIKSCDECKRPFCSQCLERVLDRDLCFEDLCTECRNAREDI